MPLFGKIVVIRRDGVDGAQFPLTATSCVFGRNADCDIRVQLPNVAKEHSRIEIDSDGKIFLVNLCPLYPTLLNKKAVTERVQVQHMDVFTVTDRSFRVEFPPGSPFRKGRPSTNGSVLPIQEPPEPVRSGVPEPEAVHPCALPVEDAMSLLSTSVNSEQSAAETKGISSKMDIKYATKVKTPTAKARTPSYPVRTPIHKGKTMSPAVRSSTKFKARTPVERKSGIQTPLAGQTYANSRTRNANVVTPRSQTPVASSSIVKSNSMLLADEIAKLKLALTKPMHQSPAWKSVPKTPVGTSHLHSYTVKKKTPAAGDRIMTPSVTSRVRCSITPKPKTPNAASIVKSRVVTPASKAAATTPRSKGLASSIHRVKKVMIPSPRAKTPAQKRRASSITNSGAKIAKKSPLQNNSTQTDSMDASQGQRVPVDSILETLCGDKASSETVSSADDNSQRPDLSLANAVGHQETQSPKISFPAEPSTRQKSLSPASKSPGRPSTRRKSRSPLRSPSNFSPRQMLQIPEILTSKRLSSSTSNAGANEFVRISPSHKILLQASGCFASQDCAETADSTLETSCEEKTSHEAMSSDEKEKIPKLSPIDDQTRRKSRSSKICSPAEHSARRMSQSPNIVEAHAAEADIRRRTLSPKTRSPARSSSTRKSQSPLMGSAQSSTHKVSQSIETPAQQRRSSSRVKGTNKSPLHEVSLQANSPNAPQILAETVDSSLATSFADRTSNEIFSPSDEKLKTQKLSPAEACTPRKLRSSMTRSPSSSLTRYKSRRSTAKLSAQKKSQSSQMFLVDGLTYRNVQNTFESPAESTRLKSQGPKASSTRSRSFSPLAPPAATSAGRYLRRSSGSPVDPLTRNLSQSVIRSPASTSRRKSQSLEDCRTSKTQDRIPAVVDECSESYEQPFSPLVLEMDDVDENNISSKKSTPISSPLLKGGANPDFLMSVVDRLRRKSLPLQEESEDEIVSAKSAGKKIDTTLKALDETFEERSFVSPSQGVKRPGSPLTGRRPKRCVSFGPDMSPELFDRSLPVATPLKRGATPRRASTSVDLVVDVRTKPLLKTRQSTLSTAAAILVEEPLETTRGKSPKHLKTAEKLSEGERKNPVPESVAAVSAKALTATDFEPSLLVTMPLNPETKPHRGSFSQADIQPKRLQKSRRATLATAGVYLDNPFEDASEKSPKGSSKAKGREAKVDVEVLTTTDRQTPKSSAASPVTVASHPDSQTRRIFTSRTDARRLSKALNTQPTAEVTTSNENSLVVKPPTKKEKTPTRSKSLPSRSFLPLTNMQNSSMRLQEYDPFAFESSPESSPTKLTPKPLGLSKNVEVKPVISGELANAFVSKSARKKSLSKSQENITTPKFPLEFAAASSPTSVVKSAKSVGKRLLKDVSLELEDELPIVPMTTMSEGSRSPGRRFSKPKSVPEAVHKTPARATPISSRSVERQTTRFLDKEQKEQCAEMTPSLGKSSSRRSMSSSRASSTKTYGQTMSEHVSPVEEQRGASCKSAAKIPTSAGQRRKVKSDETLKPPDTEMAGGSLFLPVRGSAASSRGFSERKSSSPFKRPFGSEPRKLRSDQIGQLFRLSPEEARKAAHTKNVTVQMISARNIDLSSLSPLKFYKLPAVEALTGKRSKVTPGRAVALRAVYGKSAVPPLAELCVSREASAKIDTEEGFAKANESTKSLPAEKSSGRKVTKRKKSAFEVAAKKSLAKKTGFAVKRNQTKVLLLKTKVGRKSVGQVAKRLLASGRRNLRAKADNAPKKGQNSLPNNVLEFSSEKGHTLAELSKSRSSYSDPETPNGPGEMSISPWSSPVVVSGGKRRSSAKKDGADDTSEAQKTSSFAGFKRLLTSPKEVNSPNLSGLKSIVLTSQVEASPKLSGVKQLAKTPKGEKSPQLCSIRKLVKTPKVQKSPRLSGMRNLVKTPKVQKSPQLSGIRNLLKSPKVQKSPQLNGIRNLVKTPKTQKSPQLIGVRKLVKTPKVQKSPQLSGVKNLLRTPKVQESPDLTGVKVMVKTPRQLRTPRLGGLKRLVSTPKLISSPDLTGLRELVKSPATQSSPDLGDIRKMVKTATPLQSARVQGLRKSPKTPKQERSPRLGGLKALIKTPKMQPSPKLSGLRELVCTPKEILSPELEGLELLRDSVGQQSAKKTRVNSRLKGSEVVDSLQFGENSITPSMKEITPKAKNTKKCQKSFLTPIFTEMKGPQESGSVAAVTPVRPVRRHRKQASQADVVKVEDIQKPALGNIDHSVKRDGDTVTVQTRKRRNAEPDEKPAAKKGRSATETEEQSADDNKNIDGKELPNAARKGRGLEVAAEASTMPSEFEVTASVPKARGRSCKERAEESTALQVEPLQVTKLAGTGRTARAQRAKTTQVEQMTMEENVKASVPETVNVHGRQSRLSKKDLAEEATVESESKAKSKTRAKGKSKAMQAEVEVASVAENVGVSVPPEAVKSNGRRQGKAKKDTTEDVVHSETVVNKAERKTRAKGKGAISTEVRVASEQVTLEENAESVVVKVGDRRQGRAKNNVNEEVTVQSKTVVSKPEKKGRARGLGKTTHVELEVTDQVAVEENVEASVQETVKLGARRQGRLSKKDATDKAAVESEIVLNDVEKKGRGRGKAKTQLAETVEEKLEETVTTNARNKKQTAKEVSGDSSDDTKEEVEVKRPVRGKGMKSGEKGKGKSSALEEVALAVHDNNRGMQLNKKNGNVAASSGRKGRKGTVVEPVSSDAEVITEAAQNSRKRKTGTAEDVSPGETKKARLTIEAVAIEASTQVSSLKPSKRGSRKATTVGAKNKDGSMPANENLSATEIEPTETPAGSRNKRKTTSKVSSTAGGEVKKNSLEPKRSRSSANKAKSAESNEAALSKNTVTPRGRKAVRQTSDEIASKVDLPSKGKARKVRFDIPSPVVIALEKSAQLSDRGRRLVSKRGSGNKSESKELPEKKPKARVSRHSSPLKGTTAVSAKRPVRASRK